MIEFIASLLFTLLPPCQTEDSSWCSWDATSQGNGTGTSFVSLTPDIIIYVD
jgi:hypothetical protein